MKICEILKLALKELRNLFFDKKDDKNKLRVRVDYNQRKQVAQRQRDRQQKRPVRTPGMGVKNIEGRVRNRRFKIKRMIAQPKNVEVKKTGRVVCKIVVTRSTVYVAEVRRGYY